MTIVAIHQPNYAPWLGYFYKMARADLFVFLDDVQFSKQSYINRVKILGASGPRWLTQPAKVRLGQAIGEVVPARRDWAQAHLDTLRNSYVRAAAFKAVWPDIQGLYERLPEGDLAAINQTLIVRLAARLGVARNFRRSSDIDTGARSGDDRLVAIVAALAPGGAYLSGKGGAGYQDEAKFASAGLSLAYTDYDHPVYEQGDRDFVAGLSVLDAVFHLGWNAAAALIHP